jgi:hypothetical protein
MSQKSTLKNESEKLTPKKKIEYYFLRKSAESFAADLNNFAREADNFTVEQLYVLVSFYDFIRDNMANIKKELEERLENE